MMEVAKARLIIDKHFPGQSLTVVSIALVPNHGYSDDPDLKTYLIDLQPPADSRPTCSCFLSVSQPTAVSTPAYHPNALPQIAHLLSLIRTQTGIPISKSTLDTSQDHIPYHYLLSALCPFSSTNMLSLADARRAAILTPTDNLTVDLLLGAFLGQLHSRVHNDSFGLPLPKGQPPDAFMSWEEVFTGLLDALLMHVQAHEHDYACLLPYADIRLYLSRAIGASLFEDVDESSLVWFTGSEEDIFLGFDQAQPRRWTGRVAAILPNVAHALWGDPLLECFMMGAQDGEGPTKAFMEGYLGSGGKPLVVFPRQKTKRLWYTVFLALVVLTKYGVPDPTVEEDYVKEKRAWARETLKNSVDKLKDAPYSCKPL